MGHKAKETYTWATSFLYIQCCSQAPCPNELGGSAETGNHRGEIGSETEGNSAFLSNKCYLQQLVIIA